MSSQQELQKRNSVIYDTTHKLLPAIFFLHFLTTGTVVLIYTLHLHEPLPAAYSVGAAITFGCLIALIASGHLFLYFRRMHRSKKDVEVNPISLSQKDRTGLAEMESWFIRLRNFLILYEVNQRRHVKEFQVQRARKKAPRSGFINGMTPIKELSHFTIIKWKMANIISGKSPRNLSSEPGNDTPQDGSPDNPNPRSDSTSNQSPQAVMLNNTNHRAIPGSMIQAPSFVKEQAVVEDNRGSPEREPEYRRQISGAEGPRSSIPVLGISPGTFSKNLVQPPNAARQRGDSSFRAKRHFLAATDDHLRIEHPSLYSRYRKCSKGKPLSSNIHNVAPHPVSQATPSPGRDATPEESSPTSPRHIGDIQMSCNHLYTDASPLSSNEKTLKIPSTIQPIFLKRSNITYSDIISMVKDKGLIRTSGFNHGDCGMPNTALLAVPPIAEIAELDSGITPFCWTYGVSHNEEDDEKLKRLPSFADSSISPTAFVPIEPTMILSPILLPNSRDSLVSDFEGHIKEGPDSKCSRTQRSHEDGQPPATELFDASMRIKVRSY